MTKRTESPMTERPTRTIAGGIALGVGVCVLLAFSLIVLLGGIVAALS